MFRARGLTRYYWLRAIERVYAPGAPGHVAAIAQYEADCI
jgi:hypothetical protein